MLRDAVKEAAPTGYNVDYSDSPGSLCMAPSGFVSTMLFALVIVYLALAAQFESFRDPVVILCQCPWRCSGRSCLSIWASRRSHLYEGWDW